MLASTVARRKQELTEQELIEQRKQALTEQQELKDAPLVEVTSARKIAQAESRGKRAIAQSPYQLFRAQWLMDQRVAGRGLAAHQGHGESRAAWDALKSDSVVVYGDLASARRVQAALARQSTGGGSVAASTKGVPIHSESSLVVASKDRTDLPRGHVAVDDWFCGHCGIAADARVSSYSDLCFSGSSVPFSSRLAALFGGAFTKKVTIKAAEKEFKRRVEQTPPERAVASFKEASYRTSCGALCRSATPAAVLSLHERLMKDWVAMVHAVAPRGKVSQVPLNDLLFAVDAYGASASVVTFVAVVAGMGKWFRYPTKLGFAVLSPIASVTPGQCYENVKLRPERLSFVPAASESRPPPPLGDGRHGRVRFVDHDELGALVVNAVHGVQRIVTVPLSTKLCPSEVDFEELTIQGAKAGVEVRETVVGTVATARVARPPAASGSVPSTSGLDLLGDLSSFRSVLVYGGGGVSLVHWCSGLLKGWWAMGVSCRGGMWMILNSGGLLSRRGCG